MKVRTRILAGLAATAGIVALSKAQHRPVIDLNRKIVLITGGSRGLGLAMAREFGAHGAIIVICARDKGELARAQQDLTARGIPAHAFVCDITQPDEVLAMVAKIAVQVGHIEILVNNAGIIMVGPVSGMDAEDFDRAMRVMFWGTLHTTFAVLPAMKLRKQGSIVNITSIGAKVSVPHLLPYSCAKFAALAFSEGLRTELAPTGIRVTTIAPSLLRTGSHLNAEFKGRQTAEYAWFAAGAATPLVSIGADRAAKAIVRATVRGESEKVLSIPADFLARFHGLFPGLTSSLFGLINRMLPDEGVGFRDARPGHEIEAGLNFKIWKFLTKSGQTAAESFNEIAG